MYSFLRNAQLEHCFRFTCLLISVASEHLSSQVLLTSSQLRSSYLFLSSQFKNNVVFGGGGGGGGGEVE